MYGERLKELRVRMGLNQGDMAEKLDVPRSNISYWENQIKPSLEAIEKYCSALNIPLWEFFATEQELAEIKTGGKALEPEYIAFIEAMKTLEQDTRNEVWELFLKQLELFKK